MRDKFGVEIKLGDQVIYKNKHLWTVGIIDIIDTFTEGEKLRTHFMTHGNIISWVDEDLLNPNFEAEKDFEKLPSDPDDRAQRLMLFKLEQS